MIKNDLVGLRALEREDMHLLLHWRNNEEMRINFRETRELNMDNQLQWFNSLQANKKTIMFGIEALDRDTNQSNLIGVCGLCNIDWINATTEISHYIGLDNLYVDSHYSPQVFSLLTKYAFNALRLNRTWLEVFATDHKKQALCEQLVFKQEACLRESYWVDGAWCDSFIYSKLASDI